MHKLTTIVIALCAVNSFVDFSFSEQSVDENHKKSTTELKQQIDELQQQQIDKLQQYVFNLQDLKHKPNVATTLQDDELVEQVKLLRKEMEYVIKELKSIRSDLDNKVQNLGDKLNSIESEIDEQSNDKQILNLIDSQLGSQVGVKSNSDSDNKFEDTQTSEKEKDEYQTIVKSLKNKDFDAKILEFKKFIKTYPNSILNSNVYFYLGEIQYQRKNYTAAAVNYLKGFQFDQGTRTLNNLVMLAKSLSKIGSYDKACKVVDYVHNNYHDKPFLIKQTLNEVKNTAKCGSKRDIN
jgi:TolA-binding protein